MRHWGLGVGHGEGAVPIFRIFVRYSAVKSVGFWCVSSRILTLQPAARGAESIPPVAIKYRSKRGSQSSREGPAPIPSVNSHSVLTMVTHDNCYTQRPIILHVDLDIPILSQLDATADGLRVGCRCTNRLTVFYRAACNADAV